MKQSERDKVSQEMDEWQNLDEDQKKMQYMISIKENKQPGYFIIYLLEAVIITNKPI